jgi:hypothetical protein
MAEGLQVLCLEGRDSGFTIINRCFKSRMLAISQQVIDLVSYVIAYL